MTKGTLLACLDASSPRWELGHLPSPAGPMALFGWTLNPPSVDGGMPALVIGVFARAICSLTRITYPASVASPGQSGVWHALDGDYVARVQLPMRAKLGLIFRALSARDCVLRSTRNPASAIGLFDDPRYPWWLRGQFALLSPADAPAPPIDGDFLLRALSDDWAADAEIMSRAGVCGILRAGVDGDVAGLLVTDPQLSAQLLDAFAREATAAGLAWRLVGEDEIGQ
jgi:hypothetical protein